MNNDASLGVIINAFADALVAVDATKQAHKKFQPGIGPFGEADAVRAALPYLCTANQRLFGDARMRRTPDLLLPNTWALEFKLIRPFGDNGKPAEHWSQNVLHPYRGNTSALGDCLKLLENDLTERKGIIVFGYEHTPAQIDLEPAIAGFELLARELLHIELSDRIEERRTELVHPIHQAVRVFGWEVLGNL